MDPGADPGRTHGRAQAIDLTTAYGLDFRSDIAVPFRPAPPRAAPDVVIRGGAAPRGLDGPATRFGRWEAAPGALLLTVEDVARYFVRDGREIVVDSVGSESDVRAFLLGRCLRRACSSAAFSRCTRAPSRPEAARRCSPANAAPASQLSRPPSLTAASALWPTT